MQYREWLEEWLELYVRASAKERTYKKYRMEVQKYLLPALGDSEVNGITAAELQKFSLSLSARNLSASTVNCTLAVLKASLKKAVALGVAEKQYSDAIVRPKSREKKITCFSKEEQKKLEKYILGSSSLNLAGILICLYSGLRIGELLALRWEDVDLRKGMITVTKSCHDSWVDGRYVKVFDTTKTQSSERVIPIPKTIVAYIREIKRKSTGKYVVYGKSEHGAQVRSYQRTFNNLLKKLRIPHKGFHALRHTFATRALEVGMDVKTLSEILGHKNPMVTLQRYTHSLIEHKTEMMNRVGRLFFANI